MGNILCCCQSDSEEQLKLEDQKIKIPPEIIITPKIKKAIKKMKLRKKELISLWNCFKKMSITDPDTEKNKTTSNTYITKIILAQKLDQPYELFYSNLFDRWDLNRNERITFEEFVIGLYKFLLSKPSKYVEYIFQTFDVDGDGYLMGRELGNLLEELHGIQTLHALSAQSALYLYDRKKDGRIDLDEFEESVIKYPVIMWKVTLCQQRFINKIINEKFWYQLFIRLYPSMKNNHHQIWIQNLKSKIQKYVNCCSITSNVCIKLFQCILYPICPCFKKSGHIQPKNIPSSPKSRYAVGQRDNDQYIYPGSDNNNHQYFYQRNDSKIEDVSLKIGEIISNSTSPSKHHRKSRIQKSKINANIFSDTQEVEKRLDLEVIGDHDSSDSEIKQYIEKETRAQRIRQRQRSVR